MTAMEVYAETLCEETAKEDARRGVLMRMVRPGLALIEVAMVLGIAAIVVAGAMFYFANANENSRTNEASGLLSSIQEIVRTAHQGQGSYTGLNTALVANNPMLPNKYRVGALGSATGINSPFGQSVTVAVVTANTGQFDVTFNRVPRSACMRMATMDLGTGLVQITVQPVNAAGSNVGTPVTVVGGALTPSQANGTCGDSNATGGANITWRFS